VVGKLFADQIIGKETIKSTMVKGWRPSGMTSFKVLGENIFLVEFEHLWDKSWFLEGRPWVFEGSMFAVMDFSGTGPPAEMNFEKVSFWVRMFNLPLAFMSETMGFNLGNSVGVVEEVESDEYGIGWGEYLCVKICLDISKPLARGCILKLKETTTWVAFQYERLPRFCFQCGSIRHGPGGCLVLRGGIVAGVRHKQQFGSWLRASTAFKRSGSGRGSSGKASVPCVPSSVPVAALCSNLGGGSGGIAPPRGVDGIGDPPGFPPFTVATRGGGRMGPTRREVSASGSCGQLVKLDSPPTASEKLHVDVPKPNQGLPPGGLQLNHASSLKGAVFLGVGHIGVEVASVGLPAVSVDHVSSPSLPAECCGEPRAVVDVVGVSQGTLQQGLGCMGSSGL
jgi:hypothetical protein